VCKLNYANQINVKYPPEATESAKKKDIFKWKNTYKIKVKPAKSKCK